MKRLAIAAFVTFFAIAAGWCQVQAGTYRVIRTVAANLIAPVIAAQSADAAVPKKPVKPASRPQCAEATKAKSTRPSAS